MRLEHFNYIIEIARCKSMSKASKKLFITQPSLSTAIQGLEDELGFQIFTRSRAGVALTDKGEQLLEISKNIVSELDKIQILADPAYEAISHIKVSAVPFFCNAIMFELIAKLERDYPLIDLAVLELRPKKILPALADGQADIAIGTYYPSNKEEIFRLATKNNITLETVFEDKMYCFVHRNHPAAHKDYISASDLANDTPAFFYDRDYMDSYAEKQHGKKEFDLDKVDHKHFSFSDRASIQKAIAKGLAYAIMPRMMAYDDIYVNSGMIIPMPMNDTNITITTYVAYRNDRAMPRAYRQIIDTTRSLCAEIAEKVEAREPTVTKEASNENNPFIIY